MKDNRKLEQLSVQQLEEMLRQELNKQQPEGDTVRQILAELRTRTEPVDTQSPAVQAAVRKFKADEEAWQKRRRHQACRKWLAGVLSAAAVLCVVLLAVPGAANAESIWERLARWTETVFAFFSSEDDQSDDTYVTDHPGLQQVYDAVTELGITQPVVPTWLPEEYELSKLSVHQQPAKARIYAKFNAGTNLIAYTINENQDYAVTQYSKDEEGIETYENGGIIHYILRNGNRITAIWNTESIECSVCVEGQEEVLYQIIDSIYEREAS